MRVIKEFSQRKSQRLLSCNKNGKRRSGKILTWLFSHSLPCHLLEKWFYLSQNVDRERTPRPTMQEGSLWTMVNFMLCSTKYKSIRSTWNSVEYGHGVGHPVLVQFRDASHPRDLSGRDREPQHIASDLSSYQKKTAGRYWFWNVIQTLDSEWTVAGTTQVNKMLQMKICSWKAAASQPLWKGEYNHKQHLLSWTSSPLSAESCSQQHTLKQETTRKTPDPLCNVRAKLELGAEASQTLGILWIIRESKIFQQSSYHPTHCLITLPKAFKADGSWYNLACHSIICGHAVT